MTRLVHWTKPLQMSFIIIKWEGHAFWTCHVTISNNCVCLKAKELQQCCCVISQNSHCQHTLSWLPWLQLPVQSGYDKKCTIIFLYGSAGYRLVVHNSHMLSNIGLPYLMRRNSLQIYVSHCNQFVRRKHFCCDINSGCIQSTLPPSLSRENRINTVQSKNSKN